MIVYDLVEKVTFYRLENSSDRRGVIALFRMKNVPNRELAIHTGVGVIQRITTLLDSGFEPYPELGEPGEQNDSFIHDEFRYENEAPHVTLCHKYWSEKQVAAFEQIVQVVGQLHGWEVSRSNLTYTEALKEKGLI